MPVTPAQVVGLLEECNLHLRAQNADIADVVPTFADLITDLNV